MPPQISCSTFTLCQPHIKNKTDRLFGWYIAECAQPTTLQNMLSSSERETFTLRANDALSTEVSNIATALRECAELSCKRPGQSAESNNVTMVQSAHTPVSTECEHFLHALVLAKFHQCGSSKFKARGSMAGQSV